MLKSSGAMGLASLTSRVLGLAREQLYGWMMGTTGIASAYFMAFNIPNLFRRLLGEGVLSSAFIPVFKAKEKNEGEVEMWRAANAVISGLILVSAAICLIAILVATGMLCFSSLKPETRLMYELLRIMFPYMIVVCLAAVFMGMLNARGHFFIPALGAAVLNVVMISTVLIVHFAHLEITWQMYGLAIGVLIAGIAQAFFQFPTLRREGYRYQWVSPWSDPSVREVVRKMIPASVGVAAFQINSTVTQGMAFGENSRIVSEFQFAVRLMEFPQGVFGISLATFLLPTLSALALEKNYGEFRTTLRQGLTHLVFVNLLATVLLFTLAEPMVRLIFQHGKFDAQSTNKVSFALLCLAPGLIAFSMVNILARAFYALSDMKTPMHISLFCIAVNFVFTVVFLFGFKMGAGSLGLANTISSICNVVLLSFALRKKLKTLEMTDLLSQLPRMGVSALAAGLIAWWSAGYWQAHFGHEHLLQRLGEVFVPITAAAAVYFGMTLLFKVPSAHEIINLLTSRLRKASQ